MSSGTDYSLGNVVIGQTGSISTTPTKVPGGTAYDLVNGFLPPDSEIVFTYSFNKPKHDKITVNAIGSYSYNFGPTQFNVYSKNGDTTFTDNEPGRHDHDQHDHRDRDHHDASILPIITSADLHFKITKATA